MKPPKKSAPAEKANLHPRSKHRERYDFDALIKSYPALAVFVRKNEYHDESINFFNPEAVLALNKALLKHFYGIDHWSIPKGYLCPPIPGRADYIHNIADLLQVEGLTGKKISCLDIGIGANCIYPILGAVEYGWDFVGTDIDTVALEAAQKTIDANPVLKDKIVLRRQFSVAAIFAGVVKENEHFDVAICNPPFHASLKEAHGSTVRKLSHLKHRSISTPTLNFGGQSNELWCPGGEPQFVKNMINQSKQFSKNCTWFTTLISKSANLEGVYNELKKLNAAEVRTLPMGQGNKISRIVAWRF
jgi:23S rRNA (adenine1618-N6)-methyltransferase